MTDTSTVPRKADRADSPPPVVDEALADQLLAQAEAQGVDLLGPDGLLSQVTKAVLERALGEELTEHLGYDKHDPAGRGSGNSRNGSTPKTLLTEVGPVELDVPRDRAGSFSPRIVRKGQTRLEGFNERIIALYARGMTTRDIRAHLREIYGVEVSPDLISRVTDGVLEELSEWQNRPLEGFAEAWQPRYPAIVRLWRAHWEQFTPFLDFPPPVRRVIYTTNLIESMNARLRKVTRNRGQFPSEQAALKVLYLAVRNLEDYRSPNVGTTSAGWKQALQAFTIYFEGRIPTP